jgi:hypothetical protein
MMSGHDVITHSQIRQHRVLQAISIDILDTMQMFLVTFTQLRLLGLILQSGSQHVYLIL